MLCVKGKAALSIEFCLPESLLTLSITVLSLVLKVWHVLIEFLNWLWILSILESVCWSN